MNRIHRLVGSVAIALALQCAISPAAAADRDEFNISLRTMSIVIGMSLLGGLVSWIAKVRRGDTGIASLQQLVGELCTSAFAGFLCYLACEQFNVPQKLTILFVGVSGHMGARAISAFEAFAERKWGALTGSNQADSKPGPPLA